LAYPSVELVNPFAGFINPFADFVNSLPNFNNSFFGLSRSLDHLSYPLISCGKAFAVLAYPPVELANPFAGFTN
jgi:hypothetical protein